MSQKSVPATALPDLQSSGDLIADRRFGYALALLQDKDADAAMDLFAQVLERVPDWPPALLGMGDACLLAQEKVQEKTQEKSEANQQAAHYFRLCLAKDPSDRLGAGPRLARLNEIAAENAIRPGYVAALFDDYAKRFDSHLVDSLDYRAPQALLAALLQHKHAFDTAYDLGCGTGLMGALLRPHVRHLGGCDLSSAMLHEARKKNIYDRLDLLECVEALKALEPMSLDLVTAADVVVYIGVLTDLFLNAHASLKPDGLLALTAQSYAGEQFIIGEDLRSAHSETYLREQARLAGFDCLCLDAVSVRKDRGQPVSGWLGLFRKTSND